MLQSEAVQDYPGTFNYCLESIYKFEWQIVLVFEKFGSIYGFQWQRVNEMQKVFLGAPASSAGAPLILWFWEEEEEEKLAFWAYCELVEYKNTVRIYHLDLLESF